MSDNNNTQFEAQLETIVSNPADRQALKGFIDEIVICQDKITREREAIRDIRNECKEKLGIKPKQLNMLVREFKDPGAAEAQEAEWASAALAAEKLRERLN